MYEGVAEQLHQFIASTTTAASSVPITPFTFPINHHHRHHHHGNNTFEHNYPSSNQQQQPHFIHRHPSLHHPILAPQQRVIDHQRVEDSSTNFVMIERETPVSSIVPMDSCNWSNDEVLALLKIRSSLENWFPDFTNWDHVSRKMAEQGFKRSAEKCKQRYDEESRFFNMNTTATTHNNNKNKYMFLSELEELFHGDNDDHHIIENKQIEDENNNVRNPNEQVEEKEEDKEQVVVEKVKKSHGKKKYRKRKFEMMKCFCEGVVRNIMAQQEELYNKILEDMVKRDEEIIAREEAWKKQEINRFNKEVEIRANEQAIACDRQATINEFFKNFTFSSQDSQNHNLIEIQNPNPSSSNTVVTHQNHNPSPNKCDLNVPTSKNLKNLNSKKETSLPTPNLTQNPNTLKTPNNISIPISDSPSCHQPHQNPTFGSYDEDKYSKRWPRDEVLALINLRSNFYNKSEEKEGTIGSSSNNKGPLWEKISQGMIELGYKRNAKRCKEKWENINKYFRKTKDNNANKKRSLNSRTCPYFHQLSNLYKQGTPSNLSEDYSPSSENHPKSPQNHPGSKDITQAHPPIDFEL